MRPDLSKLKDQIPEMRWFGAKGRRVTQLGIVDVATLRQGPPDLVVAIAAADFETGPRQLYHLLLLVDEDGTPHDASHDAASIACLGDLMAHAAVVNATAGQLRFAGPGLDPLSPPGTKSVRAAGAEQSNTSIVLDEDVILKLFRRVEIGPNPDLEITRALTNERFEHSPAHVGEVVYEGTAGGEDIQIDLAIAQTYLPDSRDGWSYFLDHLHRLFEAAHDQDAREDVPFLIEERVPELIAAIDELGDATAALHVALSRDDVEPELAAEPVDVDDVKAWAESPRTTLRWLLDEGVEGLDELAPAIEERLSQLEGIADLGLKSRVHGDFHLGQALHSTRGWQIIDFEGEPARTLEERRAKQSPLKDVAGMLRSFSYAALVALHDVADPATPHGRGLLRWADAWEALAETRLLNAYLRRAHEGTFLPRERRSLHVMLDCLQLDKALYEVGYELRNRPDWIHIPMHGIRKLLGRESP